MPGSFLFLSLALKAVISIAYDDIVINLGIRGYNTLSLFSTGLLIFFILLTGILGGTEFLRYKKEMEKYTEEEVRREEAANSLKLEQNKSNAYLDTSGQLVERLLRNQLKEGAKTKW